MADETWSPITSQINALVACLGALIGTLRHSGHIDDGDVAELFRDARSALPAPAQTDGGKTLDILRLIADSV